MEDPTATPPWARCAQCWKPRRRKEEIVNQGFHLLPCFHLICSINCLQSSKSKHKNDILECPKCKIPFQIEKVLETPLLHPLEAIGLLEGEKVEFVRNCEGCIRPNASAANHCQQCSWFLCQICCQEHLAIQATMNHTLKPCSGSVSIPQNELCSLHPEIIICSVCTQCDVELCEVCLVSGDHQKHPIIDLDDFITNSTQNLLSTYQTHSKLLKECTKKYKGSLVIPSGWNFDEKQITETLGGLLKKLRGDALERQKKLHGSIQENFTKLDSLQKNHLSNINSLIGQCERITEVGSVFELASRPEQCSTLVSIFKKLREAAINLKENEKKLITPPCPTLNLSVNSIKSTLDVIDNMCPIQFLTPPPPKSINKEAPPPPVHVKFVEVNRNRTISSSSRQSSIEDAIIVDCNSEDEEDWSNNKIKTEPRNNFMQMEVDSDEAANQLAKKKPPSLLPLIDTSSKPEVEKKKELQIKIEPIPKDRTEDSACDSPFSEEDEFFNSNFDPLLAQDAKGGERDGTEMTLDQETGLFVPMSSLQIEINKPTAKPVEQTVQNPVAAKPQKNEETIIAVKMTPTKPNSTNFIDQVTKESDKFTMASQIVAAARRKKAAARAPPPPPPSPPSLPMILSPTPLTLFYNGEGGYSLEPPMNHNKTFVGLLSNVSDQEFQKLVESSASGPSPLQEAARRRRKRTKGKLDVGEDTNYMPYTTIEKSKIPKERQKRRGRPRKRTELVEEAIRAVLGENTFSQLGHASSSL